MPSQHLPHVTRAKFDCGNNARLSFKPAYELSFEDWKIPSAN